MCFCQLSSNVFHKLVSNFIVTVRYKTVLSVKGGSLFPIMHGAEPFVTLAVLYSKMKMLRFVSNCFTFQNTSCQRSSCVRSEQSLLILVNVIIVLVCSFTKGEVGVRLWCYLQ